MGEKRMTGFPAREDALRDFFAAWEPRRETELVALDDCVGRVLAEDAVARYDLPVVRSSAYDGVVVRSIDFAEGIPNTCGWQYGVDYVRADTGDDFPDAFDAVVMIEKAAIQPDGSIAFDDDLKVTSGFGVNPRGSTVRKGMPVLKAGSVIRPTDLAALCLGGASMVCVLRRPRVAFLPTGSELVAAGEMPTRGQMIESNSLMVKHMLASYGAEPLVFPIVRDDVDALGEALDRALACADVVVINGGSAVGSEDFNVRVLGERGKVVHHYIAAAPGRPLMMAVMDGKPVIDLPGPPLAAYYGADWCLQAVVKRILGVPMHVRQRVRAVTVNDYHSHPAIAMLGRWDVWRTPEGLRARGRNFKAGELIESLTSNAYRVSPIGESFVPAGTEIELELLGGQETIPDGPAGE